MLNMIKNYLEYIKSNGASINTLSTYQVSLISYYNYLQEHNIVLLNVDVEVVRNYKKELISKNYSINTIYAKLIAIRCFHEYLIDFGYNVKMPCPRSLLPCAEKYNVKALNNEERAIVLKYLDEKEEHIRVIFLLMFHAGLRISEVVKVKNDDFKVINNRLTINVNMAKGNKSRIAVVYDGKAAKVILDYIKNNNNKYFAKISYRTIQYHARRIQEKLGIKFSAHVARHTFASNLLHRNIRLDIIQDLLGHENIATTRIYAETLKDDIVNLADQIES